MTMTNKAVFPQIPDTEIATLTSPTAITSRANITGTTGLVQLTALPVTNPKRVDAIVVKSKGTSLAGILSLWIYNGTTSYLYDEIDLTAVTPSTTLSSMKATRNYLADQAQGSIQLGLTEQLYVSVSVTQDLTVFATTGQY
jgi:hypothetical protein